MTYMGYHKRRHLAAGSFACDSWGFKEIMGLSELNANPDPDSLTGVTGVYQNRPLFLVNVLYISYLTVCAL